MAGTGSNNHGNGITDYRRRLIAGIMVKRPGITRRQLHEAIAKQVKNPRTKEPYSLATIQNDVAALKEDWRERAQQDYDTLIGIEWAKLDEAEKCAWEIGDKPKRIAALLRVFERRAKLKGLDAPDRLELGGAVELSHDTVRIIVHDDGDDDT